MSLASLFNDFPSLNYYENGNILRRRTSRPLLYSILDTLEDQMDQKVGNVLRRLPAIGLNFEDIYENSVPSKKRKLHDGTVNSYEPKSKVVVSNKDNKFCISLNTSSYQPEEITVKVVNDKIAISAKHEAKGKDVYEFYEMYRSFDLPVNADSNTVTSHLSASGQLTVEAPLKALPESTERSIPVHIEGKEQQSLEVSETPIKDENTE